MSHANAALIPRHRLRLARLIVEYHKSIVFAARFYNVSCPTAKRSADRYAAMGPDEMSDRSSRPHRSPHRTPQLLVRKVVHLRWKKRLGPVAIGAKLGMPASTVHAVLVRCRLNKLHHVDVRSGEVVRRYEHDRPGAMIHVNVKKRGNIPDGGGHRFVGRQQGGKNQATTPGVPRSKRHDPQIRTAFVHTVIDDHSRVAYAEIHNDETAVTAVGVLQRAVSWFAARGITVERVLSHNGSAYKSHLWRDTCRDLGIKVKKTRPYLPQTSNAFTEPWPTAGPSAGSTQLNQPGETPCRPGSTNTNTTGPTPQSEAAHRSVGYLTSLGSTSSWSCAPRSP